MQDKRSGLQAHVDEWEQGQKILSTLNQQLQFSSNQNTKSKMHGTLITDFIRLLLFTIVSLALW